MLLLFYAPLRINHLRCVLRFTVAVVLLGLQLRIARRMLAITDVGPAPAACRRPRGPHGHTSGPLGAQKRPSAHLQLRLVVNHVGRRLVLHLAIAKDVLGPRLRVGHRPVLHTAALSPHPAQRVQDILGRLNLRLIFQHQARHVSARTNTQPGRDLSNASQLTLQPVNDDLLHVVLTAFAQRHRRSATWLLALFAPMQTAPTARPPLHRNGTVRLPRQKAAGTSSV